MINTIFKAVRYAFNNKTIDFKIDDELTFSKILFENGLIGIVTPFLSEGVIINKKILTKLNKALDEYITMDIKQSFYIEKIRKELNQREIPFVFLKGAHLKLIYPNSYMRAMADIDIIVKEKDFDTVINVFNRLDFKLKDKTNNYLNFESIDEVEIELHQSVLLDIKDKDSIYANFWEYFKDDKMNLEYELVYLVKHLAYHFRNSLTSMRSFLDIEVFERHYEDIINYDLVYDFLEKEGLKTFYEKVKEINLIILNNKKYDNDVLKVLNYLFKIGINNNQFDSKTIHDFKGSKFKHFMKRRISFLFKDKKNLKHSNKALKETKLVSENKEILNYFGLK